MRDTRGIYSHEGSKTQRKLAEKRHKKHKSDKKTAKKV
jgi:hypothetical protein